MWQLLVGEATSIVETAIFVLLFGAYYLAQDKKIRDHRRLMEYMFYSQMFVNVIMVISFLVISADVSFIPHILVATPLNLLVIYTFLLMERKLPKRLEIPRDKRPLLMRITAVCWGLAILSGLFSFIYFGM